MVDNIMHVKLSGKFPVELLREDENAFQPLISECCKANIRKVIIDICNLDVKLSIMELFKTGEDASELKKFGLKVALLAKKETISYFFDNVTQNRGDQVRVFTDYDIAVKWLTNE